MRGQNNNWYRSKLECESIRLKQQRRREIESGDTVMRAAFIAALVRFAARGKFSAKGVVIPTGHVDGRELARVVCALVAARKNKPLSGPMGERAGSERFNPRP